MTGANLTRIFGLGATALAAGIGLVVAGRRRLDEPGRHQRQ
ncbi:hypothetical protein H9X94_10230 [Micromonospora aurantiaca]|nr:hypothetical protein [Micromonospora aurantiaca]